MEEKSFEKRLEDAKKILDKLMDSEITLSDSVKLYKDGIEELKSAQEVLERAKLEYEVIKNGGSSSD